MLLRREPAAPIRFAIATPPDEGFSTGPGGPNLALSPDGRRLAYHVITGSTFTLYVRSLDRLDAVPLTGSEVSQWPFFSPDGDWIAFYSVRDRALKKIAVAGGPAIAITSTGPFAGGSWGADGTIVYAESTPAGGLFRVPASGGKAERLTTVDAVAGESDHRSPHLLPGGRQVLFTTFVGADVRQTKIAALDLETRERKVVIDGGFYPTYVATGHLLFSQPNTLLAVPFDLGRLETRGTPTPVQDAFGTKLTGVANFGVSANGMLVYAPGGTGGAKGHGVWIGRDGRELGRLDPAELDAPQFPRISPDGRRVAINVAGDLWVYDLDGRPPIKLTFDGSSFTPLWSPDGQRLAFEASTGAIMTIPSDGSSRTPALVSPPGHFHPHAWSSDGDLIAAQIATQTVADIVKFAPGEKPQAQPVVQTDAAEGNLGLSLSPDGRWLAYMSDVTGQPEVWVRPYPGSGAPVRISANGGAEPQWSRSGRELYFLEGNTMMATAVAPGAAFAFKPPVPLFNGQYMRAGQPPSYDVAADGRFLLIKGSAAQATAAEMVVVVNWFDELTRKAGGK
jgi:serine/threonine-protein kinase